jgi:hypothetical protein
VDAAAAEGGAERYTLASLAFLLSRAHYRRDPLKLFHDSSERRIIW